MAIANMQKMLLIGNNNERNKLMKKLHKLGCVEVVLSQKSQNMQYFCDEKKKDSFSQKLANLQFLMTILEKNAVQASMLAKNKVIEYTPYKHGGILTPKPGVTFEEFSECLQYEASIEEAITQVKKLSSQILEIKTQISKHKNLISQTLPYKNLPYAFSIFKNTKNTSIFAGSIAHSKVEKLTSLKDKGAEYEFFAGQDSFGCVVVVIENNKLEDAMQVLSALEFSACPFTINRNAKDVLLECNEQIIQYERMITTIIKQISTYENTLNHAQLLHDFYTIETRKLQFECLTSTTQSSYYLEAWLPSVSSESINQTLQESSLALAFLIREPLESETPPVLVVSSSFVAPYEDVTNMFSSPYYKEIDPNPFVAFFFFLFFGMMLSDAGYGLILTLGAGVLLAFTKPPKGQHNLVKIMFMGGISTFVWGMIFGSYFGMSAKDLGLIYWFNPIEDPMMMLILSLGMGIFQMCFGIGINMVSLFKKKKPFEAICSAFSWYFLILGLAFVGLGGKIQLLKTSGWIMLGLGLIMLMIAGTFSKKGIKKISGAFSNLYGIVNFFSDLMSYTRIFGLGLATAVIGMVFNQIGMVIKDLMPIKFLGWIGFFVIVLVGHIFNLGINALGAYVHNSRLQFVEFFGKFYTGGGKLMQPLGSEMKYYYIKSEEAKK